jgi:hypothetical protein
LFGLFYKVKKDEPHENVSNLQQPLIAFAGLFGFLAFRLLGLLALWP